MSNIGQYAIFNKEEGWAGKIIEESENFYVLSCPMRLNGKNYYIENKDNCLILNLESSNENS